MHFFHQSTLFKYNQTLILLTHNQFILTPIPAFEKGKKKLPQLIKVNYLYIYIEKGQLYIWFLLLRQIYIAYNSRYPKEHFP